MLDDQRDKGKRVKDWTREWRQGSTQVKAGKNLSVSWVSIGHVWCNRSYQHSGLTIRHPYHRHSASLSQQRASPNLLRPPVSAHIPSGKFRDYKQEVPKVGNRYQKVAYWHQQLVTWDTGISRASPENDGLWKVPVRIVSGSKPMGELFFFLCVLPPLILSSTLALLVIQHWWGTWWGLIPKAARLAVSSCCRMANHSSLRCDHWDVSYAPVWWMAPHSGTCGQK